MKYCYERISVMLGSRLNYFQIVFMFTFQFSGSVLLFMLNVFLRSQLINVLSASSAQQSPSLILSELSILADRGHFYKIFTSAKFSLLQNLPIGDTSTKFSLLQNFHFYKIFTSAKFSLLRFFTLLQNFHFCKIFTSTFFHTSAKFSLLQNFHFYVFSHFCKIFTSAKFSNLRREIMAGNL